MRLVSPTLLACAALVCAPVFAQQVVAPSPKSSATMDLFTSAQDAMPARRMNVSEIGLPLTILAKEAGFLKVEVGGKFYWVRNSAVQVSRTSTAQCGALAQHGPREQTASTPGASTDACPKN